MIRRSFKDSWLLLAAGIAMTLWLLQPIRHANDIWWHLASARFMTSAMQFPRVDVFSSTAHGQPWIDHEWLYELILYGFFKALGVSGVLVFKALLVELSLWLQWIRLRARNVSPIVALAGLGVIFWASRYGWNERADLVSVLGLSYTVWAFESWATPRPIPRRVFALPIVFMAWANMHGGFVLGLIVCGLFVAYRLALRDPSTGSAVGIALACAAATLINPYGIALHESIIEGLFRLKVVAISEWQSTPWTHLELFWVSLGLFWVVAIRQAIIARISIWELGLSLFLSWSAARYVRNVPYFMVAVFPLAFIWISQKAIPPLIQQTLRVCSAVLIALSVLLSLRRPFLGLDPSWLPVAATDFVAERLPSATFYNDYTFGSYWLWRLGPTIPDFIDGRFHMIQGFPKLFSEIADAQHGTPAEWNTFLSRHGVDAAIVPYPGSADQDHPLQQYFPSQQWALVYWDDLALIYVRRTARMSQLLKTCDYTVIDPEMSPEEIQRLGYRSSTWANAARAELAKHSTWTPASRRAQNFLDALLVAPVSRE